MSDNNDLFLHYVQLHERAWGSDPYPQRPRLADILKAPVVAFWYPTARHEYRLQITLHRSLQEVETHLVQMLLHTKTQPPTRRLSRLFVKGQQVRIKGLNILWEKSEEVE
jgi:hypothetical protein